MEMAKKELLDAHIAARYISERMNAAFWCAAHSREFLISDLPDELRKLAAAMGYDIVKKEEAPADA